MALNKIRLGDYIERSTANNHNLKYGPDLITGVNSQGIFAFPKGSQIDLDLAPYKIVNNGAFVYNPTRLNLGSIAYRTEGLCIVSHLYIVFYLNQKGRMIIDPNWLYIYFRREEFQREVTFRNFGSQRPEFSFSDMCDIEVPLPPLAIQQKYVDIYNAALKNQQCYERGLEDLKLVCDGYIDNLRSSLPLQRIGDFIEVSEETNANNAFKLDDVRGVSIDKMFIDTKADMKGVDLTPYAIVYPKDFAYVTVTSRNGEKISLAYNDSDKTYICSSSYIIFHSKDCDLLLPEYLRMYFERSEFNRYARFNSWGSARETFDYSEMENVRIPIPSIEEQKCIAEIFTVYSKRKSLNEQLKVKLQSLCPILIKGSILEAQQS